MTTFTEKVEELFDRIYDLGYAETRLVGQEEYDEHKAEKLKAKQALTEAHQAEISRVLERVEKEIIGEDESVDSLGEYNVPSWNDMRRQAAQLGKNQLRAEQRQAINKIKGEYSG